MVYRPNHYAPRNFSLAVRISRPPDRIAVRGRDRPCAGCVHGTPRLFEFAPGHTAWLPGFLCVRSIFLLDRANQRRSIPRKETCLATSRGKSKITASSECKSAFIRSPVHVWFAYCHAVRDWHV